MMMMMMSHSPSLLSHTSAAVITVTQCVISRGLIMVSFPEQSFEEANAPYQDTMALDSDPDLELHYSLGEVKSALGEIRERLDDIHMGEVHYRHSGNCGGNNE